MKVLAGLVPSEVYSLDLKMDISLCARDLPSGCVCILITSLYKDTSHIGLGTTI